MERTSLKWCTAIRVLPTQRYLERGEKILSAFWYGFLNHWEKKKKNWPNLMRSNYCHGSDILNSLERQHSLSCQPSLDQTLSYSKPLCKAVSGVFAQYFFRSRIFGQIFVPFTQLEFLHRYKQFALIFFCFSFSMNHQ